MRDARHSPVSPGQIWVIEQNSAQALAPLDRDAVATANVVLYDRALAAEVAELLPVGTYAEPLPHGAAASTISPRAVKFAAEGWSVVQLVRPQPGARNWLQHAAAAATGLGTDDLPVRVVANTAADRHRRWDGCLRELPVFANKLAEGDAVTLVLGPLAVVHPAPAHVFTANGLAG